MFLQRESSILLPACIRLSLHAGSVLPACFCSLFITFIPYLVQPFLLPSNDFNNLSSLLVYVNLEWGHVQRHQQWRQCCSGRPGITCTSRGICCFCIWDLRARESQESAAQSPTAGHAETILQDCNFIDSGNV